VGSCGGTRRGGGQGGDRFIPCAYKQKRYMGWERCRGKKAKGGRAQETRRREYGTSKDALFQNNTKPQRFERSLCVWLSNPAVDQRVELINF